MYQILQELVACGCKVVSRATVLKHSAHRDRVHAQGVLGEAQEPGGAGVPVGRRQSGKAGQQRRRSADSCEVRHCRVPAAVFAPHAVIICHEYE